MAMVWQFSPVAAAEVCNQLRPAKSWNLSTVRTLLKRLVKKGILAQHKKGKRYLYQPLVSRASCVCRETDLLYHVGKQDLFSAIENLVKRADLSHLEIQDLQRTLNEKQELRSST